MMNDKSIIYLTYDKNFHEYLKKRNIVDLVYGLNPKSLKKFWIYKRDDAFNIELEKWLKNSKVNDNVKENNYD